MSSPAAPPSKPDPAPPSLIFDWKHRPHTWARLTFWLFLVLIAHLAGFVLFSVRTPPPARAMPVPTSIVLAPAQPTDPAEPGGYTSFAGLLTSAETADLDLPEQAPTDPHVPSFADHKMARQPWPARPERAAWPEISAVSQPVLPPPAPASPSEGPTVPPR
jgi:hypothetical protein